MALVLALLLLAGTANAFNLTDLTDILPKAMAGVGGPFAGIGAATYYGTGDGALILDLGL